MAKSFQLVVVSRSYKDWNSAAGTVKVLAEITLDQNCLVYFLILYRLYAYFLNDFQCFFFYCHVEIEK